MSEFRFRASKKHYPVEPVRYTDHGVYPEEEFPSPEGILEQRNFIDDLDCLVEGKEIIVKGKQHLPYKGKEIKQDPVENGEHILHPIEVVIDENVAQEMARHGRSFCGERKKLNKLESAGFLAGYLKRDRKGRLWTHVTKSIHDNPPCYGAPDEVTIPQDTQMIWSERIKKMGLVKVGIWHTHPTYEPFQSDAREWGADVQATASNCQHWWSVSVVVDPYGEDNAEINEEEEGYKQAVMGCYKMVQPGTDPADLEDPLYMGWRSVAFGIRDGGEGNGDF